MLVASPDGDLTSSGTSPIEEATMSQHYPSGVPPQRPHDVAPRTPKDPWLTTAKATLISVAINTTAQVTALAAVVVGFFLAFDFDSWRGLFEGTASPEELDQAFADVFGDGAAWAGYALLLVAVLLALLAALLISGWVVTRHLRKRGLRQPALAAWAGTATFAVVSLLGVLFIGPFILPVGYALMWVVMALVSQS